MDTIKIVGLILAALVMLVSISLAVLGIPKHHQSSTPYKVDREVPQIKEDYVCEGLVQSKPTSNTPCGIDIADSAFCTHPRCCMLDNPPPLPTPCAGCDADADCKHCQP